MPTTGTPTAIFREVLEQLALIDPADLCKEAKTERCRAARDLSSCGRYVQHVLTSCGHASLCAECSQRCDVCPICRTSIPSNGKRLRRRLFYKCFDAGLISKRFDERFQEKVEGGGHAMGDIQRLYALFDVALENNLVSLICHYVTDVCMDESAVSSDPVLAFLLDEVVVKDWCKQTVNNIINELRGKYRLGAEEMKSKLPSFQKLLSQLTGVSYVLEVMVSSIEETFSGPLHDLHHMLESTLKAKQHLEIMIWCVRHDFLENIQSRYPNYTSWIFHFLERKTAAVKRAWPDFSSYAADSSGSKSTLFIEEAITNLGIEPDDAEQRLEIDISCLQDENSTCLQSNMDETNDHDAIVYYPFESARAAADILFLHGTSDMAVAKRAIFLYYLFDRHWTVPDAEWRYLVDDFAASFGMIRLSVQESLTFYLLDDHTEQAIQEAISLLPEIAGPDTHPKIAQVLLERQHADVALTVLRCSGHDGPRVYPKSEHESVQISLSKAITALRVRIECGLLTESFMYQRMHCSKVEELASRTRTCLEFSRDSKVDSWVYQVEVLVTEICQLCIRRNLVDRMIELPWNSDEEKFVHKSLFSHACQKPASTCGSLLVVFYLQRYRYVEAYQVDFQLRTLEQKFSETANEDVVRRIDSISHWRAGLVDKSLELLPEAQRQQAKTGSIADGDIFLSQDICSFEQESTNMTSEPSTVSPSWSAKPSVFQKSNRSIPPRKSPGDTPMNFSSSIINTQSEPVKREESIFQRKLLSSFGSPAPRTNSIVNKFSSSCPYTSDCSPSDDRTSEDVELLDFRGRSIPIDESKRNLSKMPQNGTPFKGGNAGKLNSATQQGERFYPFNFKTTAEAHHDLMDTSPVNGLPKESAHNSVLKSSLKLSGMGRATPEESALLTQRSYERDSPMEDSNMRIGSRWRSDETGEDELEHELNKHIGGKTPFTHRRARFSRR